MNKSVAAALVAGLGIGFLLGRTTVPDSPSPPPSERSRIASTHSHGHPDPGEKRRLHVPTASAPSPSEEGTPAPRPDRDAPLEDTTRNTELRAGVSEEPQGRSAPAPGRTSLAELDEPEEVAAFLDSVRQNNFFESIRRAEPFDRMNESLEQLSGRFVGNVRFLEDTGKQWEMVLEAALRIEGRTLQGDTRILLSENGRVFSQLTGDGDMRDYRRPPGGRGIVVKASPDDYFHLYYVPRRDGFAGNYYRQVAPDQVVPRGTVWLDRG